MSFTWKPRRACKSLPKRNVPKGTQTLSPSLSSSQLLFLYNFLMCFPLSSPSLPLPLHPHTGRPPPERGGGDRQGLLPCRRARRPLQNAKWTREDLGGEGHGDIHQLTAPPRYVWGREYKNERVCVSLCELTCACVFCFECASYSWGHVFVCVCVCVCVKCVSDSWVHVFVHVCDWMYLRTKGGMRCLHRHVANPRRVWRTRWLQKSSSPSSRSIGRDEICVKLDAGRWRRKMREAACERVWLERERERERSRVTWETDEPVLCEGGGAVASERSQKPKQRSSWILLCFILSPSLSLFLSLSLHPLLSLLPLLPLFPLLPLLPPLSLFSLLSLYLYQKMDCPACTFRNHPGSLVCEICNTGLVGDAPGWNCSTCTYLNNLSAYHTVSFRNICREYIYLSVCAHLCSILSCLVIR